MDEYFQKIYTSPYMMALAAALRAPYDAAKDSGEFLAAGKISYDRLVDMKKTGKKLVGKYGKNVGAGDGIDNYYHPLLQCELSRISPESELFGITLGNLKEIGDYFLKTAKLKPQKEIVSDSKKDLQNNMYGSNIGVMFRNIPCQTLLDNYRTRNMRYENIY